MLQRTAATETGGRAATTRSILPKLALAVGMPSAPAPPGWKWTALTDLARLESGHTPSRRHPEYWGGKIPWISIQDARDHHGRRIAQTKETTNELGITNSSARVLPKNTVCLSRTASVGYVVVMDRPMATSQDFVNWVCSPELDPDFLKYLFIAEGDDLLRFASGAVHQTIYFPEAKAFHICHPTVTEQRSIVRVLDRTLTAIEQAKSNTEANRSSARAVFENHLNEVLQARPGARWRKQRLGNVVDRLTNGYVGPTRNIYQPAGVPYLLARHVKNNRLNFDQKTFVSDEFNQKHRKSILKVDDVLLVQSGHIGHSAVVPPEHAGHNCHAMIVISPKPGVITGAFLSLYFSSLSMQQKFETLRTGSTLKHLNCRDVREIEVPLPSLVEQAKLVTDFRTLAGHIENLESIYKQKWSSLEELERSLLQQAFSGGLSKKDQHVPVPGPSASVSAIRITPIDMHAGVIGIAYQHHKGARRSQTFGHVKAEKIAHLVESIVRIDLGRNPVKDAAGPNDYPHFQSVRHRAKKAGYFEFKRSGDGYRLHEYSKFDDLIARTHKALGEHVSSIERIISLFVPMTTQQAEIVATVYAAWNNLLLDGREITDEAIVREAREDWHPDKLKIPREKFFKAIEWMKEKQLVPSGSGKRVENRTAQ